MNKTKERIITVLLLLCIIILFFFLLKDIIIPFVKAEINKDFNEANRIIKENGWLGALSIVLVEAMQMVIVFVPAEFIQVSAGLSFPFIMALILCDLGVCLGASIIYVLVKFFRFTFSSYKKAEEKIHVIESESVKHRKHKNIIILLLLLFIMPFIPFGAICYFGCARRLPYSKYLPTVAVGVIPSILSSNLVGYAGKEFIRNSIPLWVLVLIIIALGIILFALFSFFSQIASLKNLITLPTALSISRFLNSPILF